MARFTRKRVMIGLGVLAVLFLVELALHRTHLWTRETHIDLGSGRLRRETAILWPTRIQLRSRIVETRFSRIAEELGVAAEYPTRWCLSAASVHVGFIITGHRLIASTRCGRTQASLHECAVWMDWMDRDALDVLGLRYGREEKRETVRHLLQLLADGEKTRAVEFVNSLYRLPASHLAEDTEQDLTAEHLHMLPGSFVGDEEIARVANPEEVRELYLSRTNITDRGLALMPRFVNLETLNLRFCDGITDAGIARLAELGNLRRLYLDGTEITDAGIAHLAELRELRYLSLSYTQVTDAGIAHLVGLKQLRSLALDHTRITDESIDHLSKLERIETIGLCDARLTYAGVKRLKAEIPEATVFYSVLEPNRASTFAGIFTIVVLAAAFILRARRPPGTRARGPALVALWLLVLMKASVGVILIGMFLEIDSGRWLEFGFSAVMVLAMVLSITYIAAVVGSRIAQMKNTILEVISSVFLCAADLVLSFGAVSTFVRFFWISSNCR